MSRIKKPAPSLGFVFVLLMLAIPFIPDYEPTLSWVAPAGSTPPSSWEGPQHPYFFPRAYYEGLLEKAQSDEERFAIYDRRWDDIRLVVCHVAMKWRPYFWRSVSALGSSYPFVVVNRRDVMRGDLTQPTSKTTKDGITIEGDSLSEIDLPAVGYVHVRGNVEGTIRVPDSSEIVIGGNLGSAGKIIGERGVDVFIGGDANGEIVASGGSKIWIEGDFNGRIHAGDASLQLLIRGDFEGEIISNSESGHLMMIVEGYASAEKIEAIDTSLKKNPSFAAFFAASDLESGFHPQKGLYGTVWVVEQGSLTREKFFEDDRGS